VRFGVIVASRNRKLGRLSGGNRRTKNGAVEAVAVVRATENRRTSAEERDEDSIIRFIHCHSVSVFIMFIEHFLFSSFLFSTVVIFLDVY
jgi:hypothetical protein